MKLKALILLMAIILFLSGILSAQAHGIVWNTFLGCGAADSSDDIVRDSAGNIYMTGYSWATWGSPVNAHSGNEDIVVACLDSSGNLLWNTFLGSGGTDKGEGIALDSSGNVYVTGYSMLTWGSPLNAHKTGDDALVACLDSSGNLLWHTFLGSANGDWGYAIVMDGAGNIYIIGGSWLGWGTPVMPYTGTADVFVAKLDSSGNLIWNTFMGSTNVENGRGIALDAAGNVYVTGYCSSTWGSPINAFKANNEVFVASLDNSGNLIWNTFLGSYNNDYGYDIKVGEAGKIFVTGNSYQTWGTPVNAHSGEDDVLVACLDSSGNLLWNTFVGSSNDDYGRHLVLDSSGNIYITGDSDASWGSPVYAHSGGDDAFVACLSSSGNLLWNTFLGSGSADYGYGIVAGSSGNVYMTGFSLGSWGSPVNAHSGNYDIFTAALIVYPHTDIAANGSDGPVSITESDSLKIRVSLNTFGSTDNVDYWLAYRGPSGWVHYNNITKKWETGLGVTHQGPLMDLNNKKVFQSSGLAPGNYTFYFGVDMNMDGKITKSSLYKDEVKVTVTSN